MFLVYIISCHNKQVCLHPEIHHNMHNMTQITTAVVALLPNFSGEKNKYLSNAQQTYYKNNFLQQLTHLLTFITCIVRSLVLSYIETVVLFCLL